MAVRIRLMRMGKKKQPTYRVVVVDGRKPRDGEYIELIGRYDPRQEPSLVEIDNDRALDWLNKGAQPSDTARKLLTISGAWTRFQVAKGNIMTVGEPTPKPVITEPTSAEAEAEADEAEAEAVETIETVEAAEAEPAMDEPEEQKDE